MTKESSPPQQTSYPSDLTDAQGRLIEPHIPPGRWGGRTREVDMREVVNGILYLARTGRQWRYIPNDLPKWGTVRGYFDRFRRDGTWDRIRDLLRGAVRVAAGKVPTPLAIILDSRTVKATEKRGPVAGTAGARRSTAASGTWRWTRRG